MFEKLDKTDLKVLKHISDNPYTKFYLRQIARELNISSSSAKKAIDLLERLKLIKTEKMANLRIISGNMDEHILKQYKILENIDLLRELVKKILPAITITLYGSFAKGENDETSDIDLFVMTNNKKTKYPVEYKGYSVQATTATPTEWKNMKDKNKPYTQEIMKGITIHGEPIR